MTISKTLYTLSLAGILYTTPYTHSHLYAQSQQPKESAKQTQNYDSLLEQVVTGLRSDSRFIRNIAVLKAKPMIQEYSTLSDIIRRTAVTGKSEEREALVREIEREYSKRVPSYGKISSKSNKTDIWPLLFVICRMNGIEVKYGMPILYDEKNRSKKESKIKEEILKEAKPKFVKAKIRKRITSH